MIFAQSSEGHIQWLESQVGEMGRDAIGISALMDDGVLAGVCGFDKWTEGSAHIHIALANKMCLKNHQFIYEVFNYAFNTADKLTLIATIQSDNKKSLNFTKHMGFNQLAIIQDGVRKGIDIVILELRREFCTWINEEAA